MDRILHSVAQFGLNPPFTVEKVPSGLIHKTFLVHAREGEFVIQELHKVVRPETCEDAKAITDYVRSQGIPVPEFLVTHQGKPWHRAADGSLWRVMLRLPGTSHDTVSSPAEAYAAAQFLGKFHGVFAHFSYKFRGTIPHFHDTPHIFEQFKNALNANKTTLLFAPASSDVAYILAHAPKEFLPPDLPSQIIHGDPKISNFLFHDTRIMGLIDFDTCMNHTKLVDIGDALRSWCNRGGEDAQATFDRSLYEAALEGYTSAGVVGATERALVPQAFLLITIELAMRFLQDYFEDSYFRWDAARFANRREHNLARARNQIELHRQITEYIHTPI
ncbi:MAG: hypothetical protein Greene071421_317 [Parcubacteria group bacterium Greene0714_21]|nr:MAG: hypothetical protein Greene041639_135 [Parcubacteria group bacterium Greene0416_39]TSC98055.1 MAG: hypothetical protein Greene101447_218 [Parcubacteria group bacterium Greene1014_47]TSD04155.1 MAG: hypothetical protein Greene071421_317 [Parcubacteria group bacterium Greene0714_21]